MWKSSLLLALLLIPTLSQGLGRGQGSIADPDALMRSKSKPKQVDREVWKRDITATMALLEGLSQQLKEASVSETAEVWESGVRDFKLRKGVVEDCQKAVAIIAASGESNPQKARDKIKSFHKGAHEEFLTELRNWISVNEAILSKARQKERAAAAAQAVEPTPSAQAKKK